LRLAIPNETDAAAFSGISIDSADGVFRAAGELRRAKLLVTRGEKGAFLLPAAHCFRRLPT
jgi:sugar/nucleoside kinase (ribokinase family)